MNKKRTTKKRVKKAGRSTGDMPVLRWLGISGSNTLLLLTLLALVLVSGLSVVRVTHQNRFAFNELQELKEEAVALNVQWGQLLIEQSTFGLESRIEKQAASRLNMQIPDMSKVVMVNHD